MPRATGGDVWSNVNWRLTDEAGSAAGSFAGEDVALRSADHPRAAEIDAQFLSESGDRAGPRFAAVARVFGMEAVSRGFDGAAEQGKFQLNPSFDRTQYVTRYEPS